MDDYKTNDQVSLTARCTLEELAQILSDNVDRIVVWDQPSLDAVASVSVNGNSVQLNVESSDQQCQTIVVPEGVEAVYVQMSGSLYYLDDTTGEKIAQCIDEEK